MSNTRLEVFLESFISSVTGVGDDDSAATFVKSYCAEFGDDPIAQAEAACTLLSNTCMDWHPGKSTGVVFIRLLVAGMLATNKRTLEEKFSQNMLSLCHGGLWSNGSVPTSVFLVEHLGSTGARQPEKLRAFVASFKNRIPINETARGVITKLAKTYIEKAKVADVVSMFGDVH